MIVFVEHCNIIRDVIVKLGGTQAFPPNGINSGAPLCDNRSIEGHQSYKQGQAGRQSICYPETCSDLYALFELISVQPEAVLPPQRISILALQVVDLLLERLDILVTRSNSSAA